MNGIKIFIPPLAEQKRIVDLISSVDSYIEALQQQVDKEYDPGGIFPSKQISPNDEFFKLALKNGKPDAPDTRFDKFIKPYL